MDVPDDLDIVKILILIEATVVRLRALSLLKPVQCPLRGTHYKPGEVNVMKRMLLAIMAVVVAVAFSAPAFADEKKGEEKKKDKGGHVVIYGEEKKKEEKKKDGK
jgi:hypothetical protein